MMCKFKVGDRVLSDILDDDIPYEILEYKTTGHNNWYTVKYEHNSISNWIYSI